MRQANEIINLFNLKYNNINSGIAPGINTYEISQYLTEAQRQIIDSYYNGTIKDESFESTERLRKNISKLIKSYDYKPILSLRPLTNKYKCYTVNLDEKIWRVTWEKVIITSSDECINNLEIDVFPTKQDYLNSFLKNPYKKPSDNKVLRVDIDNTHELISKHDLGLYKCICLEYPKPFIVGDLEELSQEIGLDYTLSIENESNITLCIFDNFVEDMIINRAVELATQDYKENSLQNLIPMNQRNE